MKYSLINRIYAYLYVGMIDVAIFNQYGKSSLIVLLPCLVVFSLFFIKTSHFDLDNKSSKGKRIFNNWIRFFLYGFIITLISNAQFGINYFVINNRWIGFLDKLVGLSIMVTVLFLLMPYSLIMAYLVSRKEE